jgi:hypothetical protein
LPLRAHAQATRVGEWLRRRGWRAREIQGDMPQWQRTETVAAFKAGSLPLLIATDVAARGLDIPGVECVINYRRGGRGGGGVAFVYRCGCAWHACVSRVHLAPSTAIATAASR